MHCWTFICYLQSLQIDNERFITAIFPICPVPVGHDDLFGICAYDKIGVVTHHEYLPFFLTRN